MDKECYTNKVLFSHDSPDEGRDKSGEIALLFILCE